MRIRFVSPPVHGWNRWFAWHPVFVGPYVVWLETVERYQISRPYDTDYWEYRLVDEDAD